MLRILSGEIKERRQKYLIGIENNMKDLCSNLQFRPFFLFVRTEEIFDFKINMLENSLNIMLHIDLF